MISKASVQPPRGVRILVLSRSQVTASSLSLSFSLFLSLFLYFLQLPACSFYIFLGQSLSCHLGGDPSQRRLPGRGVEGESK